MSPSLIHDWLLAGPGVCRPSRQPQLLWGRVVAVPRSEDGMSQPFSPSLLLASAPSSVTSRVPYSGCYQCLT